MLSKVVIIAGESSGELYGALLARHIKALNPQAEIKGVGGQRMRQSGVELIAEIASSFGVSEAVKTFLAVRQTFYKVIEELKHFCPQVVILIDYPDFNIRLAQALKKNHQKILYFVSPQVWAWRQSRVYELARHVDKMAVILPFEPEIYAKTDLDCRFVGHPIMDELRDTLSKHNLKDKTTVDTEVKAYFKSTLKVQADARCIVLMPGSRRHEVLNLFDTMLSAVTKIRDENTYLLMPIAPNLPEELKTHLLDEAKRHDIIATFDAITSLLAGDFAVIASGTSSLQATFTMTPMVVIYKVSWLTYFLGRLLVNVNHISLTNIILDKLEVKSNVRIKELLQGDVSEQNIIRELSFLIHDEGYRHNMLRQFEIVVNQFADKSAIKETVEIAQQLASSPTTKLT